MPARVADDVRSIVAVKAHRFVMHHLLQQGGHVVSGVKELAILSRTTRLAPGHLTGKEAASLTVSPMGQPAA